MSGASRVVYKAAYRALEALLNLGEQLSAGDLAVRFGCEDAKQRAEELLAGCVIPPNHPRSQQCGSGSFPPPPTHRHKS